MNQEHMEQLLDLFRTALEKGHRYVLCVECESKATLRQTNAQKDVEVGRLLNQQILRQTNINSEAEVARLLEKFARQAREAA